MSEYHQRSNQTDEEIVRRVQQGDSEQFGVLIERYTPKLLRYGRRFLSRTDDITDLVQDTFIRAYSSIQSFNTSMRFSPWIYRIAHNAFVNELRAQGKGSLFSLDLDTLVSPLDLKASEDVEGEKAAMRSAIDRGLSKISPKYQEVLILYYFEELSYADIADILHIPVSYSRHTVTARKKVITSAYRPSSLTVVIMDHLPTNHIKESVLEKIARKKVVMQPRRLFVFQWISITIVALIILVLGVLTLSFATYSIHESGELFLLGFGIRGVYTFFALFPWALIAGTFASIIIFLWLLRGSTLAYRIPILYLFGAFTLGCFLMGLMINSTPFHQLISELAEKNQHTFIQTWYERINLSDEAYGEFRGMVVSVDTDSFVVSYNDGDTDEDDTTHTVVPLEGVTIADVAVGDEVYIAGDIKNGVIHAYGFGILRPHTQ